MTKPVHTYLIAKMKITLLLQNFHFIQWRLNSLLEKSRLKYYTSLSEKVLDPGTCPK